LSKLKKIVQDMNPCTGIVTPKLIPVTTVTTTRNGTQVRNGTYETKKVLTVTAAHISAAVQAERYHFSDEQKKQLNELMSDEYNALWDYIIGSSDEILTPGGSYTGTDIFAWPLAAEGRISSRFGTRADPITGEVKTHGGTDIAAAQGTPILAAADGTVIAAAYNDGGYGYYVKIQHNATYATLYGHCSVLHVKTGQQVKQGQVIAEVGSTGHSTGNHLHFEVIQNGVRVDAMKFFINN
ncbi:MAG: M23 family metallopeptidase, partial [Clostridia bacterium]|nr:M23 family metallopeptidase [Clostridia bacterium]